MAGSAKGETDGPYIQGGARTASHSSGLDAFKEVVGVTSVRTEEDYAQARATIEVLLDEIGDNEKHPLADVLDYLADQVATYEAEHYPIPEAEPKEVLRFLMD